jgi:serine/threonine kinase PknH
MNMRQVTVALALALASACIFVASCSRGNEKAAPSPTTISSAPAPVAADVLYGLLLSPAEINTAMRTTGILINGTYTDMFHDNANIPDKDCRFIDPAEAWVYDGSGWIAMRSQHLHEPGDDFDHEVLQAVVAFPSANDAARFFSASAQRGWQACSNRQYHNIDAGKPDKVWTVGPIANTNGTLSTTDTLEGGNGWACQRALTVSNNIAIDVAACSDNPADAAVNVADQIAAKVGFTAS